MVHQTGLRGHLVLALAFSLSASLSQASPVKVSHLKIPQVKQDTPNEGANWPKPDSEGLIKDKGKIKIAAPGLTVSIPVSPPAGAGNAAGDFVSFGFESSFFPHYDNEFSANLVDAIASRMSMPIVLRVGGTSGDLLTVDPNQGPAAIRQTGDCFFGGTGSTDAYTVGPAYFDTFKRFPNAAFTVQAPMGDSDMDNTMAYVNSAWNAIGDPNRVKAIALGNEPNYYLDAQDYVTDSINIENQITSTLKLDTPMFELGDLSQDAIMKNQPYNL